MAFTYQGQLKRDGVPLDGVIDGRFSLWTSESSDDPAQRVGLVQVNAIDVENGLFQAELNFGQNAFNGNARWLQIEVHDHNDSPGAFSVLFPRQTITATPYSLQTRGIVVREDGNVGIGTKSPSSKVEIAAQDGLALTGFQPFVTLRDTNAGNQRSIIQGADGKINFYPASFIGGTPAMVISNGTGNIGIGTASPIVKLQAVGGTDTAPGGGGYFVAGILTGENISIDNNEIMARNNGQAATLSLNNDGGDVKIGGALDIGIQDVQTPQIDGTEASLECPAGKRALSGGCWCGAASIQESRYDGTGWYCRCEGQTFGDERVIVYVRCARVK